MIKALLFDFSRVLLHPIDKTYTGKLNELHAKLKDNPEYNLLNYFEINQEIFEYLKTIRHTFALYLYTSETIQEDPHVLPLLQELFRKIYSAKKLGFKKNDSQGYSFLAKELSLNSREILFIDDSENNIEAANTAGMKTIQYTSNKELIEKINSLTNS